MSKHKHNQQQLETATAAAAWPSSLKRTPGRLAFASLLQAAAHPLNALEIWAALREGEQQLSLSAVYRNIEHFLAADLLEERRLPGTEAASYVWRSSTHLHYAACLKCKRMLPLHNCPAQSLTAELAGQNFTLTGHRIELYGYCNSCAQPAAETETAAAEDEVSK